MGKYLFFPANFSGPELRIATLKMGEMKRDGM
jgi:hypothetical protein